jgi:hypothetical protein
MRSDRHTRHLSVSYYKREPLYDEQWILKKPIVELAIILRSGMDLPYDLSMARFFQS